MTDSPGKCMKEVVLEETAPWGRFATPSHTMTGSVIVGRTDCFNSLVLAICMIILSIYILSFSTQYQMQWSSQLRSYVSRHWKGLTKRHVFGWNSSSNPQNRRGPLNRRIKRYSIPFCSNWILATAHVLMTISYHVPPYMYLLLLLAYSSSINVLIRSICFYSGSYAGYRCAGPCLWVALHSGMPHQHAVSFQRTHSDAACEGYRADWIWLMKTA